jgi:hypothetical protein
MKRKYHNLRIIDWNFDYKRGVRLPIFGLVVELPEEIGDAFPKYFRRVEEVVSEEKKVVVSKDETIVTETESEKTLATLVDEVVSEIDEMGGKDLVSLFLSDLADGRVKETKKFYTWNNVKISKEDFDKAENKAEFLANYF